MRKKPKFKVGDRVVWKQRRKRALQDSLRGKIIAIDKHGRMDVEWVGGDKGLLTDHISGFLDETNIELMSAVDALAAAYEEASTEPVKKVVRKKARKKKKAVKKTVRKKARKKARKKTCKHGRKMPTDYVAWHDEAERRLEAGWEQRRCPACKLWAAWIPPAQARREEQSRASR
jgi:hypothetical protein